MGTVNAVSPCEGLYIIPFDMRLFRIGATEVTRVCIEFAISPDRCGPGPIRAIARRYSRSRGVQRS